MTLNITILTRRAIYQSADFRLVSMATGDPVGDSSKRVTVDYQSWRGFITYTGVGRIGDEDTSEVTKNWLEGARDLSFDDVAERLRKRGSAWLLAVAPGVRHTFILAGFVDSVATVAIVSNFEDGIGRPRSVARDRLAVSRVATRSHPIVIVTGQAAAVSRTYRRWLTHLAERHGYEAARIRAAIAEVNRRAARDSREKVSAACVVYSQDPHGRSSGQTFGEPRPDGGILNQGEDLMRRIRPVLDAQYGAGQWGMIQSATATSGPHGPRVVCTPELDRGAGSGFEVFELQIPEGMRGEPRGANALGQIVGEGVKKWRGPNQACAWSAEGNLVWLEQLGGFGGAALAINETGTIVGWAARPDATRRACRWGPGEPVAVIAPDLGHDNEARAISPGGNIAGGVSLGLNEPGVVRSRPFRMLAGELMAIATAGGLTATSLDIDDAGRVSGISHRAREAWCWQWHSDGRLEALANPQGFLAIYPVRFLTGGALVGTAVSVANERRAMTRRPDGTWQDLGLSIGSELTAADSRLLAGRQQISGFWRPWVRLAAGQDPIRLPGLKYHHHYVTNVSPSGSLVGSATTDDCAHPLIWRAVAAPNDIEIQRAR